jgi:hypothetical protein
VWTVVKIGIWWQPGADRRSWGVLERPLRLPLSLCEGRARKGKSPVSHLADFQAAASSLDAFTYDFAVLCDSKNAGVIRHERLKGQSTDAAEWSMAAEHKPSP